MIKSKLYPKFSKTVGAIAALVICFSFSGASAINNNLNYNSNISNTNPFGKCSPDQLDTVFGCVPKGQSSLNVFIKYIFSWFAGIVGSLAVLGLIWAAYMYVTSSGNPDSISKAKDIIWTSIASLLIIIFSFAFFKLLGVV